VIERPADGRIRTFLAIFRRPVGIDKPTALFFYRSPDATARAGSAEYLPSR
jgi:hypothetical protein